jgi:1,4-dihydroxy-2-naphthoate octaprenyltransferase
MLRAVFGFVFLCLCSGIALLLVSFGPNWNAILFFLVLGVLSIVAAIAYTVGRRPYGYVGLGDFSVLIFFGFVGVMGSLYLFTKEWSWREILPALSCGFFSMGVLNVNNIRDIESDRKAGKYSIPVRIGRGNSIRYHWALITGGLACALLYNLLEFRSAWQLLFLVSAPLFVYNAIAVSSRPSSALDPFLKQLAFSTLFFVMLFGVGLILS